MGLDDMRANIKHDVALLLTNQASRKGKSSAGLVKRRFPKSHLASFSAPKLPNSPEIPMEIPWQKSWRCQNLNRTKTIN